MLSKSYIYRILLIVLSGAIAGIGGIATVFLMLWLSDCSVAKDSDDKHGISHQSASRLGGLAVAFCAICVYWMSIGMRIPLERLGQSFLSAPTTYAILIGFVGLCDDIFGHVPAQMRLVTTACVFSIYLLLNQEVIPDHIGIFGIDSLLEYGSVAFFLCLFACLGMLNATNMADGANGLMPLVFMGAFYGFFMLSGELIYFSVTMSLMVFTLFNVLSGRLFLGDSGSYGLGALAALSAISLIGETGTTIWFFLCLAGYPVIDFFATMGRRKYSRKSLLEPDSDHMHNRLYRFVRTRVRSPLVANSVSGLAISLATTGTAILLLNRVGNSSEFWGFFFVVQVITYLVFYRLFRKYAA